MGGFYGSVQVRSENRARVKQVAEAVARSMKIRILVGPQLGGWIGLYPENHGQDHSVGTEIAKQLADDVLHLLVHDDDVFAYWLSRNGILIDSFWSKPGYFGEENRAAEEKMTGNPQAFQPIIGERVDELKPLLARDTPTPFAYEELEAFAKVLNISNAVCAYEYLKAGETTGVKGWRKFQEVPQEQVKLAAEKKRAAKHALDSEREKLKAQGTLLYSDVRKHTIPCGCAVGDRFIVAWPDYRGNVSFSEYAAPWNSPQTIEIEVPSHITAVASDAVGRRVAMAAGECVRIWDVTGREWKHVSDIPEKDLAIAAAISSDGKVVAHASREEVVISKADTGNRVLALPIRVDHRMAFDRTGHWLALPGTTLGLVSLDEPPQRRNLFVGGKSGLPKLVQQAVKSRAEKTDTKALEQQYRQSFEAMVKKLGGRGHRDRNFHVYGRSHNGRSLPELSTHGTRSRAR